MFSETGLIGKMETVNLGHVRDNAIISQDNITLTEILNANM